jgi:hypothetical protein
MVWKIGLDGLLSHNCSVSRAGRTKKDSTVPIYHCPLSGLQSVPLYRTSLSPTRHSTEHNGLAQRDPHQSSWSMSRRCRPCTPRPLPTGNAQRGPATVLTTNPFQWEGGGIVCVRVRESMVWCGCACVGEEGRGEGGRVRSCIRRYMHERSKCDSVCDCLEVERGEMGLCGWEGVGGRGG